MKKRRPILIALVGVAIGLAALPLILPLTSPPSVGATNFKHARMIGESILKFAQTNEGRFPMHLGELRSTDSIALSDQDWQRTLYRPRADDNQRYDWLYFGAFHDTNHPPPILLASPEDSTDRSIRKRIIVYPDGTCAVRPEKEYQAELRKAIAELNERAAAIKEATTPQKAPR